MDSGCFSFDLATMMSLRICISVCRVFASGVGFVCLCPGWCVEVAGGGWRECVCSGWKLGDERTLEADSCNTDHTSLQSCRPGLGCKDFWFYLGYLAGWGELRLAFFF